MGLVIAFVILVLTIGYVYWFLPDADQEPDAGAGLGDAEELPGNWR